MTFSNIIIGDSKRILVVWSGIIESESCSILSSLLGEATQLLGSGAKGAGIGALDHGLAVDGDLLAVLEEHEGGHGGDAVGASDVLGVVDVDLCECQRVWDAVLLGQGLVDGCNLLARRAPVGEEVDGNVSGRIEERLQLGRGRDVLDHCGECGDI